MQLWGWWDCRKHRCDPEGNVQASTCHLNILFLVDSGEFISPNLKHQAICEEVLFNINMFLNIYNINICMTRWSASLAGPWRGKLTDPVNETQPAEKPKMGIYYCKIIQASLHPAALLVSHTQSGTCVLITIQIHSFEWAECDWALLVNKTAAALSESLR